MPGSPVPDPTKITFVVALLERGHKHLDSQQFLDAKECFLQALGEANAMGISSASVHWSLAVALDYGGEVDLAYEHASKAVELDPFAGPFRRSLTVIERRIFAFLGDRDRPDEHDLVPRVYGALLARSAATLEAHVAMVRHLVAIGGAGSALGKAEALVSRFPGRPEAWAVKAHVLRHQGDEVGAAEAESQAATLKAATGKGTLIA